MSRSRASRLSARAALVAILLTGILSPTLAVSPDVMINITRSPVEVTVNLPVAYFVDVTNGTNNTLKFVSVRGETSISSLTYLGAEPAAACTQVRPATCNFNGLQSGETAHAIFYFLAPAAAQTFTFSAFANFDNQTTQPPSNFQNTVTALVETFVVAVDPNRVTGHSFGNYREFTTGLDNLGSSNKHGTRAFVPTNAEVELKDLLENDPLASCSGLTDGVNPVSFPCFGQASYLRIANGEPIAGGFTVTMRWDFSDLPKSMTEKKLHIVHIFTPPFLGPDGENYELVDQLCGNPVAPPCLVGAPIRLADKDIQATFIIERGSTTRGW